MELEPAATVICDGDDTIRWRIWRQGKRSLEMASKRAAISPGPTRMSRISPRTFCATLPLLFSEFRLLRTEISEKLALTGLAAALIGTGALLLLATIVLLLQAAIAGLVAYGLSPAIATLLIAVAALLFGAALVWFGVSRLERELAPPKRSTNYKRTPLSLAIGDRMTTAEQLERKANRARERLAGRLQDLEYHTSPTLVAKDFLGAEVPRHGWRKR